MPATGTDQPALVRSLRLPHATAMVVGTIIGASIFVQPSEVTTHVPSVPGVLAVWVLAGALTLIGALVCAELASTFTRSGGVYVYLTEAFGPWLGFLWGWAMFWSMHSGIIAAIAVVFARYAGFLVPLGDTATKVVAIGVILVLSLVCYLIYMTRIDVGVTLACLATTPILWVVTVVFSRLVRPAYDRTRELVDRVVLTLAENIKKEFALLGAGSTFGAGAGAAGAGGVAREVEWRQADAMKLPFEDGAFDAVVCQFAVMFFPDKAAAFSEARRVLRSGGVFLFSVWDRIEDNEFADVVTQSLVPLFRDDPPRFLARVPHGYHDLATIFQSVSLADELVLRPRRAGARGRRFTAASPRPPRRARSRSRPGRRP